MPIGGYFQQPLGQRFGDIASVPLALQRGARQAGATAPFIGAAARVPAIRAPSSGVVDWGDIGRRREVQDALASRLSQASAQAQLESAWQRNDAWNRFVLQSAAAEAEKARLEREQVAASLGAVARGARVVGEDVHAGVQKRKRSLARDYNRALADSLLAGNDPDIAQVEAWEQNEWEPGESIFKATAQVAPLGW